VKRRCIPLILLVLTIIVEGQVFAQNADRYLVMFREGTPRADRAAAVQRAGALVRFNYSIVDAVAIRVPNANALAILRNNPAVLSIVPDRAVHAIPASRVEENGKPGGAGGVTVGETIPEGVKRVGLPTDTSNGAGIGVAIMDTGIDLTNPDLAPPANSFSAFGENESCQDDNGHGTHVAGIVAALKGNNLGTIGVAPAATLYCVKVLDSSGSGSDSNILAGLNWIAENPGIRVVNISLGREGTPDDSPALRTAFKELHDIGVTFVVSAGNTPTREVSQMVPASYTEVLAIASTTATAGSNACRWVSGAIGADTASYFTTDGKGSWNEANQWLGGVTISAPGADKESISKGCLISSTGILSTKLGGGTTRMSGTSMAAPHVAGIAARMIQSGLNGPEAIRKELREKAMSAGTAPLNSPTSSYSFDNEREGIAKAP
jgi:subtilisin